MAHPTEISKCAAPRAYPAQQTLISLVEEQATRSPLANALICGTDRLTYAALEERATEFASRLRAYGVAPDVCVGVYLPRTASLVVALLGILKAGGAYVPLDPRYPRERQEFIAQDARIKVLVTQSSLSAGVPVGAWSIICIDTPDVLPPSSTHSDESNRYTNKTEQTLSPQHLAYVIYTSGSTGRPKGVAIEHRSVVNLIHWALDTFSSDELHRMLASTSISFNLSVFELFVPLSAGTTIVLVEDLFALPHLPSTSHVTFVNSVPSLMSELLRLDDLPSSVRVVALAGEPLHQSLVERIYRWPSVAKVFDLYGPTEATVYSTCALRVVGGPTTIGTPITNTEAYISDESGRLVSKGEPGELYLAGAGLARGYLGRPDLTAVGFVFSPLGELRMYRTGDRVRQLADGSLEFLGRLDHQVKIRGQRIEIGEIETVLAEHPAVETSAVFVQEDKTGASSLVAYVVQNGRSSADDFRAHLARCLPDYMVPSAFIELDSLPHLPNGKIDRAALPQVEFRRPAPVLSLAHDSRPARDPAAPAIVSAACEPLSASLAPMADSGMLDRKGPTVETIAAIWRTVLDLESDIRLDDDFFDLGGNSLLAMRLFMEIEAQFGVDLPPSSLLDSSTVRKQAQLLTRASSAQAWSPLVHLSPRVSQRPLFLVHGIDGDVLSFSALARSMPGDQPIYGLRADLRNNGSFFSSVEEVAALYVSAIRTLEPHGPYRLGGYSSGGPFAYEMAQQLTAAGAEVSALIMLCGDPPMTGRIAHFSPAMAWRMVINAGHWLLDDFVPASRENKFARLTRAIRVLRPGQFEQSRVNLRALLGIWHLSERALETHLRALDAYRPRPYPGRLIMLRGRTLSPLSRSTPEHGWTSFVTGGISLRTVPGTHTSILREPQVRRLATELDAILRETSVGDKKRS